MAIRCHFWHTTLKKLKAEKAGEIGVFGQALLIVSRDTTVNITVEGFMYARTDPDRFKQIIKESTDPLL